MEKKVIRLLIADDHPVVITGIKNSLRGCRTIKVVAAVTDGSKVLPAVKKAKPDLVLLDLSMPGTNGLQVIRKLAKDSPSIKVLTFTMHDDREYILEAVHAGAKGYLLKDTSTNELVNAIETVYNGRTFFSPSVGQILLDEQFAGKGIRQTPTVAKLTNRESQILALLAAGKSNKIIANELDISTVTVQTHRQRLMKKLDIHSVVDLTRFAIDRGLGKVQKPS
jgi:two-component system, NarL family, nitrate/nitrite response regulator NarL